ncbi:GTPase-associated system all-helical protein GASH [Psychrobacter nivimaris]|uniref:GTPase-associated system all-helical protein GASH n=1 Tax=Psychrobacter nivimaris TaxID=281738 RepID=UPI00373558C1
MSKVLDEINSIGLIKKLDGIDKRFEDMVEATTLLVERLKKEESLLIAFVLTSINQTPNSDDTAIEIADECFTEVWKSARSIYIDTPFLLYRSMLLDSCQQVASDNQRYAYILWNTISDILPFKIFAEEKEVFENVFLQWAKESEEYSSSKLLDNEKDNKIPFPKKLPAFKPSSELETINDFQIMYTKLSEDFTTRESLYQSQYQRFEEYREAINENIRSNENLKLDTLWWSKSLYSASLNKSYKEFEGKMALIVMVGDLLSLMENAPPASVSYLLFETVANLPDIDIEKEFTLEEIWNFYSQNRDNFPNQSIEQLTLGYQDNWSLKDFIYFAFDDNLSDTDTAISKLIISKDTKMTLPKLAQAIFREESAERQVRT